MRIVALVLALAWLVPGARAQEETFEELELRVTANRPRAAVVDRGSADGLARGDRVELYPREVGLMFGRVTRLAERTALVELDDPSYAPEPGTRGKARIPSARLAERAAALEENAPRAPPRAPARTADEPAAQDGLESPAWQREDDGWTPDMPLLARVRAVRPEERERSIHGRVWTSLDHSTASENDASYAFDRVGLALVVENPFGSGGRLHFDGELNRRDVDVDDGEDLQTTRLRIDRLAYVTGGTRFEPQRLGFGRFLQHAMPEFGLLDGAEWSRRLPGGHRVAASVGWMPVYDLSLSSGDDFQVAASYRWVADESERLALTGGYQKSFHKAAADRDLFVAKLEYLPPDAWSLVGTAWIDLYTSGDEAKGAGPELTQAWLTSARSFAGGSSLSFSYRHQAFPEIEREELGPFMVELANARWDRLSGRSYARVNDELAFLAEGGLWRDQDEDGADGELGLELREYFFDDSLLGLSAFGVSGNFSTVVGARAWLGKQGPSGGWRLDYEISNHDIDNFSPQNDDLPQHRLRASFDRHTAAGWSVSADLTALFYDQESAFSLGLYVQRSF